MNKRKIIIEVGKFKTVASSAKWAVEIIGYDREDNKAYNKLGYMLRKSEGITIEFPDPDGNPVLVTRCKPNTKI